MLSSTDPLDNEIKSLRILAFKKSTGQCVSNKLYSAELNDVINHPIDEGVYDFVFLANEPNLVSVLDGLNGINDYADLGNITYPEQAFRADVSIPMFQELKNVEVLPKDIAAPFWSLIAPKNPKYNHCIASLALVAG